MSWATPPTFVVGQVLTAAQQNILSGDLTALTTDLAYAEFTSNVDCQTGTVGSPITIVTAPAFTADGTSSYTVEFYCVYYSVAAGVTLEIDLWEGSSLGMLAANNSAGNTPGGVLRRKLTPSAASHTYSIRGYVSAGAGIASAVAGAGGSGGTSLPGYIRVKL